MHTFQDIAAPFLSKEISHFQEIIDAQLIHGIREKDYLRIPIYKGEIMVLLMIWNTGSKTAIHDHGGASGKVKVLYGKVREEAYQLSNGQLKLTSDEVHVPGEILEVAVDAIHAVSNVFDEPSITLNIYDTTSETMEGVRVFDFENKRMGILSAFATKASWDESPEAFQSIINLG